jgi:hypothetical protein
VFWPVWPHPGPRKSDQGIPIFVPSGSWVSYCLDSH